MRGNKTALPQVPGYKKEVTGSRKTAGHLLYMDNSEITSFRQLALQGLQLPAQGYPRCRTR